MESVRVSLILIGMSLMCPRTDALDELKLGKVNLFGPTDVYHLVESVVEVFCEIPGNDVPVQYELYMERNQEKSIGHYTSLTGEIGMIPLVITTQHDGWLICKASGHNNTAVESSSSNLMELRVVVPVEAAQISASSRIVWEGQTLTLRCNTSKATYVIHDWYLNKVQIRRPYDRRNSTLMIHSASTRDSGGYMCIASNHNGSRIFNISSDSLTVEVKEFVSKPVISMDVVKQADGGFKAVVMCRCDRGSSLITFSLMNGSELINTEASHQKSALFSLPIQLDRDMGTVSCKASNEGNWEMSDALSLSVESVGGAVTLTPFTHVAPDFQTVGVVLRCEVERGTFPQYSWFLNGSRLTGRGRFYAVAWTDDAILSLALTPESGGYYHCHASDRFDNSSGVSSGKILISREVLNRVSPVVAVVVFSSFALLVVSVSVCCVYGVVLRRRYSTKFSLTKQHRKLQMADKQEEEQEEDDLILVGFDEDATLAEKMNDSDEAEDESVDETLLYEGPVSESALDTTDSSI